MPPRRRVLWMKARRRRRKLSACPMLRIPGSGVAVGCLLGSWISGAAAYVWIAAEPGFVSGGSLACVHVFVTAQSKGQPWAEGLTISALGCKVLKALFGMGKYSRPVLDSVLDMPPSVLADMSCHPWASRHVLVSHRCRTCVGITTPQAADHTVRLCLSGADL